MMRHHKALASAVLVTLSSGIAGAAAMIGTSPAAGPASVVVSLAGSKNSTGGDATGSTKRPKSTTTTTTTAPTASVISSR